MFGKSNFHFFFPSYKEPIVLNPLNFILFPPCKVGIEIPRWKKKKKRKKKNRMCKVLDCKICSKPKQ